MPFAGWGSNALKSAEGRPPEPRRTVRWTDANVSYESAFAEGRKDFGDGIEMHCGPYETVGEFSVYSAWVDGWLLAREAAERAIDI